MPFLAGLDLGTTSIKAILLDLNSGKIVTRARLPTPVTNPRPDWSEHDPMTLWETVCACLRQVTGKRKDVLGIGIASMAEAGVPLDSQCEPLDNAIAWFDRRSEAHTRFVERSMTQEQLYSVTGQRISPSFALTKILWLREHQPRVFQKMAMWLPLPSWIAWKLCGHPVVDRSIASRTYLFDQASGTWSAPLLELAGLKAQQLPQVIWGSQLAGQLTLEGARQTGLPAGIAVTAGSHDHLCGAFACGAYQPGDLVDSSGTSSAVIRIVNQFTPTPTLAGSGYAHYAYLFPDRFVLKAGLKAAGSALDWLVNLLSGPGNPPAWQALEEMAVHLQPSPRGPYWLPHLLESGTPENDRRSKGALLGLTLQDGAGPVYRSFLESLAFWLRHNLEQMLMLMPAAGEAPDLALLGGLARTRLLSQIKADVLGKPVAAWTGGDEAATGGALLAGIAGGVIRRPQEASDILRLERELYQPDPAKYALYDSMYLEHYLKLHPLISSFSQSL